MNYKGYAKSAESFEKGCDAYFAMCDGENEGKMKKPYTVSGLCLFLGISREELLKLAKHRTHSEICKKTALKIESFIEENALLGALANNPALYSLKYNFGWTDKPVQKSDDDKSVKIALDTECEKWAN